jgi:hypothetical protein
MKIAIYQRYPFHSDLFGSYIEFFLKHNIDFVIFNNIEEGKFSWINYFEKIFNKKFDIFPCDEIYKRESEFTKIILTTAGAGDIINEDFLTKFSHKIIHVCHLIEKIKPEMRHIITTTPLIRKLADGRNTFGNKEFNFLMHTVTADKFYKTNKGNEFAVVGEFKSANRDIDDLINFIRYSVKNKYPFKIHHFSCWGKDSISKDYIKFVKDIQRFKFRKFIKFHIGCGTGEMVHFIQTKCKFIFMTAAPNSYYHREGISGRMYLAYNINVPLVVDEKLAEIYNLKGCLLYKRSLIEIIQEIMETSEDKYADLINKMFQYKEEVYKENEKILTKLLLT